MSLSRRGLLGALGGFLAIATLPALSGSAEAQPARAPSMPNVDTAPGPAGDLLPRAGNRRNELTRARFGRRRRWRRGRMMRRRWRRRG
jgi:hypothetical protein